VSGPTRLALAVAALFFLGAGAVAPIASANANISGVAVSPEEPVTGERTTVTAEINNLDDGSGAIDIERISLREAGGTDTYVRISEVGAVPAGGSVSVPLSASFGTPGTKRLEVSVLVRAADGSRRAYEYPVSFDVSRLRTAADLSATTTDNKSTTVTFTNAGNVNVSEIELTGAVDGERIDRTYLPETAPDATRSATFDTDGLRGESVTFTASYVAEGEPHTVNTTHAVEYPVPGEIRLTGVETARTGSRITVEGDAANVGGTDVESVLVSARGTDAVTPVSPSADYYLGTIEVGEFSTFELTAETGSNVTSIPVELTYIVDSGRVTTTQRVSIASAGAPAPADASDADRPQQDAPSGGGPPLVPAGAAIVLLVVALGIYRWRNA